MLGFQSLLKSNNNIGRGNFSNFQWQLLMHGHLNAGRFCFPFVAGVMYKTCNVLFDRIIISTAGLRGGVGVGEGGGGITLIDHHQQQQKLNI